MFKLRSLFNSLKLKEMKVSENITLEQLTRSQTASRKGIKEQFNPPVEIVENLRELCVNVVERVLLMFPKLTISSGYRSVELNKAIGGANSSQHTKGEAVDLLIPNASNINIARAILSANIKFDQMIIEFGTLEKPAWVHVSYKKNGNRSEILRAEKVNGKTVYSKITSNIILDMKTF